MIALCTKNRGRAGTHRPSSAAMLLLQLLLLLLLQLLLLLLLLLLLCLRWDAVQLLLCLHMHSCSTARRHQAARPAGET